MLTPLQNLPLSVPNPENISVLIATPCPEDWNTYRQILHQPNWKLSLCTTAAEAIDVAVRTKPALLVSDCDLPDGNWKGIFEQLQRMEEPPVLLVVSRQADERLWAEVLNLGGYDVLLKPLDPSEVLRVSEMAWRQWSAFHPVATLSRITFAPQFAV